MGLKNNHKSIKCSYSPNTIALMKVQVQLYCQQLVIYQAVKTKKLREIYSNMERIVIIMQVPVMKAQ